MTRKYKLIVIYEVSSKTFEGFEKATDAILKYGVTNFGDVITDQYTIKNTKIGAIESASDVDSYVLKNCPNE